MSTPIDPARDEIPWDVCYRRWRAELEAELEYIFDPDDIGEMAIDLAWIEYDQHQRDGAGFIEAAREHRSHATPREDAP
jgi:hypothetical protein